MSNSRFDETVQKPSLLLHSCCGPCSSSVVERLAEEFRITIFFYNPCITDEAEYQKRRSSQLKFIGRFNEENMGKGMVFFKETDYRPKDFFNITKGFEEAAEGGKRCSICFRQRLEKTAETARLMGYDYFGTTLTVSPHKNNDVISEIGRKLALKYGLSFLDRDFKKKDGFKRSIELSKRYELYRQNYCGCIYSKRVGDK
ncbi:MAG: epoxyqueuosine reductase QueH [Clostridiales bacterium]|nr:epoxyqueuosine reductase QueH [Clostridiales bacterium]